MGRHCWTNRLTVEDCPRILCASSFQRIGTFSHAPGAVTTTTSWPSWNGKGNFGSVASQLNLRGTTGLAIFIPAQDVSVDARIDTQTIAVLTTRPHFGGLRYWFKCGCGRRVGRLYLPQEQRVFKCRHCFRITYRSAQTHDQRKYELARSWVAIGEAIQANHLRRKLLGVGALSLRMRWLKSGRIAK